MKTILMILLILSPLLLTVSAAPMTQAEAMIRAESIWGTSAMLGSIRRSGFTWTRQVGYLDLDGRFAIVGYGANWTLAFDSMPPGYIPPTIGLLTAVARDAAGNAAESQPVAVLVCNLPCVAGVVDRVQP